MWYSDIFISPKKNVSKKKSLFSIINVKNIVFYEFCISPNFENSFGMNKIKLQKQTA